MKQETEWQVVLKKHDEVLTSLTKEEAKKYIEKKGVAEVRKVIWKFPDYGEIIREEEILWNC